MFYLDGRGAGGAAKYDSPSNEGESFGWWLSDREVAISPGSRRGMGHRSFRSPMLSCIDSDDTDSYTFAQDVSRREQDSGICEKIELDTFARDDLDVVDVIETDDVETSVSLATPSDAVRNVETGSLRARCETAWSYTPERLIRSQEYRLLVPSPRCFTVAQARFAPESESSRKARRCRKRLNCLIDSKQIGAAQLKALLNLSDARARPHAASTPVEQRAVDDFVAVPPTSSDGDLAADQDGCVWSTETTIDSSGLSYDRLNSTWDECECTTARRYSPENTSGVQTADCSLDTQNDTPLRLYDELAIASRNRAARLVNDRVISEAASILESLQNDPETILLEEEDRFSTSMSSHDRLTRLALTIETDTEMPVILDDSDNNNCLRRLHDKIVRLQHANKEIHRDIRSLRANFQYDERRMSDLSSATAKLRQDVNELRYLDDLLKLLQGELERISTRNWPFVLGHSEPHEELNLII